MTKHADISSDIFIIINFIHVLFLYDFRTMWGCVHAQYSIKLIYNFCLPFVFCFLLFCSHKKIWVYGERSFLTPHFYMESKNSHTGELTFFRCGKSVSLLSDVSNNILCGSSSCKSCCHYFLLLLLCWINRILVTSLVLNCLQSFFILL